MNLREQIQSDRAQKGRKRPFQRTLFARVSALVSEYGLDKTFLIGLDRSEDLFKENMGLNTVKGKKPFEPPLFSLVTEEQYRVATEIIAKVNCPYLEFVNAPDEILLCRFLFRRNPSLGADKLSGCHFETLLLGELAREGKES